MAHMINDPMVYTDRFPDISVLPHPWPPADREAGWCRGCLRAGPWAVREFRTTLCNGEKSETSEFFKKSKFPNADVDNEVF